jgi:hypothetical protein
MASRTETVVSVEDILEGLGLLYGTAIDWRTLRVESVEEDGSRLPVAIPKIIASGYLRKPGQPPPEEEADPTEEEAETIDLADELIEEISPLAPEFYESEEE